MQILTAANLSKSYKLEKREITVLEDVSLSITQGEFTVIQGSSGSGKTTLLSLLSGLDRPTTGQVTIAGTEITQLNEDALAPFRNTTFGFVFQSFHLIPSLTALENIMLPAELNKDRAAEQKAVALLDQVGLKHRRHNFPHQLSGGEKQRAAICRALINDPAIVFADEPTGNLDAENSRTILTLLTELRREKGATLILVTHSPEIAASAGQVLYLQNGELHNGNPQNA